MSRPSKPSVFSRRRGQTTDQTEFSKRRFATVLGSRMAYIEDGEGPPVLFIHGGIASSVLWRRQIPHLARHARCVAVDLIGTGESDRLLPSSRESYRPEVQLSYLEAFTEVLGLRDSITLVLHGWGSMIGFALAQRQSSRIRGICHMESVFQPLEWDDLGPRPREIFERARAEGGERFVMDTDGYFELATRREFLSPPGKPIIDEFRRTLGKPAQMRQALHTGLNSVPIGGEPGQSHEFVQNYARWLRGSSIPKLLVLGEPGYLLVGELAEAAKALPSQTTVQVSGAHLLQEDSPDGVGLLLAQWHKSL